MGDWPKGAIKSYTITVDNLNESQVGVAKGKLFFSSLGVSKIYIFYSILEIPKGDSSAH